MLTLVEPVTTGWLARRNPVAKLVAATLPALVVVLTLDLLTPVLVLVAFLAVLPFAGVPWRHLVRRASPVLIAAPAVGVLNAVFGEADGPLLLDIGPVEVTEPAAVTGLAIALRVLAVALPGVLVLAATDPVDLADSLVQQGRVPPRFAYGVLAALRLLPLMGEQWQAIALARRARGVDAGRSPVAVLRLFASQVLGLLVVAIRRGTRLATAMDARGFDSGGPRTFARVQQVSRTDHALVAGSAVVSLLAAGVSLALGAWRPIWGG